jgi:hypothetical protein
MIWLALAAAVYAVLQLCVLALCRAASWADDKADRSRHDHMLHELFGDAFAEIDDPDVQVVAL